MKNGLIIFPNGTKHWYYNNVLHREDAPAIEYYWGRKDWFFHGVRHREDGPAIQFNNGHKRWYLNGKCYSEEMFYRQIRLKAFW
jgi:hypothetical protein